ncbi:MAG: glycosyltransferase family 2 protein [Oscillibacter sp.]|jgi:glycosyltransferase involved in cell wall biosynthesis|nr:glycosyltransferase family 2 protein [Oscillibacter sp.]
MKEINALLAEGLVSANQDCLGNFDDLFNRSIQINEAEFRRNYQENSCLWDCAIEYDACALDFIPVADKEYVIADRDKRKFQGIFSVTPYEEDERIERTIDSVLIVGCRDIHEILSIVRQKRWTGVYIVFDQAVREAASFFKLIEFSSMFPANTKFFAGMEEMRRYFREDHDAYLPKAVFAAEPETWKALVKELHEARIQDGIPSNNVFLSICIPTYNRGKLALGSVKHAMVAEFDAEIEIVVCDNASTVGVKEYQEIADMQDSRVRYFRSPENLDFDGNVVKCLKKAKGRFALFYSDEDHVVLENLRAALEWLITRPVDMGFCVFSGNGRLSTKYDMDRVFAAGSSDAALDAYYDTYITGWCYDMDKIKDTGLFTKIDAFESRRDNQWFVVHTHCTVGMWLSVQFKMMSSIIEVYHTEENECMWDLCPYLPFTYKPEGRTLQVTDAIDIVSDWLSGEELEKFILGTRRKLFADVSYLYKIKTFCTALKAQHRWIDIWIAQYKDCLKTVRSLKGKIEADSAFMKKMDKLFLRWMVCVREQRVTPLEENLLSACQAQMVKDYYSKGVPLEEMDFDAIERDVKGLVQEFLSGRG